MRKDPAGVDVRGANLERRRDAVVKFGPVELVCLMRAAYDGAVGQGAQRQAQAGRAPRTGRTQRPRCIAKEPTADALRHRSLSQRARERKSVVMFFQTSGVQRGRIEHACHIVESVVLVKDVRTQRIEAGCECRAHGWRDTRRRRTMRRR